MTRIKNKLFVAGSIAATVLMAGALTATTNSNVQQAIETQNTTTRMGADTTIGAFANLESFDNDGFNNGVKQAATKYTGDWSSVVNDTSTYSDDGMIYVDPITTMYSNADIIISAGFQVSGAITGMAGVWDGVFTNADGSNTDLANSDDKAIVLLDDSLLSTLYTNAASISFAAEGAGFLAGVGAAVYTEYDAIVNNKDNANIVMWGGMAFPTVYDFMSGFAQAITWANDTYAGTEVAGGTYKDITIWSGGSQVGDNISAEYSYGTSTDPNTWYTFGFDASEATTSGKAAAIKTQNAIDNGASVVFPIAGGNTTVAEQTIVGAGAGAGTTRLLGVDADATLASDNKDLYIGTAAKNLEDGGYYGLWAMDDNDGDGIRNYMDEDDASLVDDQAEFNNWVDADATGVQGVQLRGTIDNGGVSFQYSTATGQSSGINAEFATAIQTVLVAESGSEEAALDALLTTAQDANTTINSADDQFVPSVDGKDDGDDSNLTWLWITLGVIAALSIIGALVYFLVIKKN